MYLESIVEVDASIEVFYRRLYMALNTLLEIWAGLKAGTDINFSEIERKYARILQ